MLGLFPFVFSTSFFFFALILIHSNPYYIIIPLLSRILLLGFFLFYSFSFFFVKYILDHSTIIRLITSTRECYKDLLYRMRISTYKNNAISKTPIKSTHNNCQFIRNMRVNKKNKSKSRKGQIRFDA